MSYQKMHTRPSAARLVRALPLRGGRAARGGRVRRGRRRAAVRGRRRAHQVLRRRGLPRPRLHLLRRGRRAARARGRRRGRRRRVPGHRAPRLPLPAPHRLPPLHGPRRRLHRRAPPHRVVPARRRLAHPRRGLLSPPRPRPRRRPRRPPRGPPRRTRALRALLCVFTENGTLYGTAIASSTPLAFVKQRLLFLTEAGAASLDLRSMSVRETPCEGLAEALNGTSVKAYSFDPSERFKAYGFTEAGDLVHVLLLGDVSSLKCRVRAVKKSEIDNPVAIQTIKGYLLVASHDKILVFNTSSQYYGRVGAPRPLFATSIKDIKSVFAGSGGVLPTETAGKPVIAADWEKLVILGLGDGHIAIYRSNFPVYRPESSAVVWSGPALLFLLFLIGIWQVYVKKKDSLGWTPEETFNTSVTAPTRSLLSHPTSDRAFADSAARSSDRGYVDGTSRASDRSYVDATTRTTDRGYSDATRAVDLRGGALRSAPRRYVSPTRYAGTSGIQYRPASAEPGLRGTPEIKYRGPGMEPPGFPKKREPLFSNNQAVVDDHVD